MKRGIMFLIILTACSATLAQTELGVKGRQFTINGKPIFLLGISYYGALGASKDSIRLDLDDMQKYGFNWFRVWATWAAFDNEISAVEPEGKPRQSYLAKLEWLIAECDRRDIDKKELKGILLDVQVDFLAPHRPRHQKSPETTPVVRYARNQAV